MLSPFSFRSGSFHCFLGVCLLIVNIFSIGASFDLQRSRFGDQFVNPHCLRGSCAPMSCERYNALCGSRNCEYCVCNKQNKSMTYFAGNNSASGKCLQDSSIAKKLGCSSYSEGYSMFTLDTKCGLRCLEEISIKNYNITVNETCTLQWNSSLFLVNNQHWKPNDGFVNDFTLVSRNNTTNSSDEFVIKVNTQAYDRWAGALVKLQLQCSCIASQKYIRNLCVVLKFTGKYRHYKLSSTQTTEILMHSTTNTTVIQQKGMPKIPDQYLASTIALSGILFLVFLFLGIGIFLILRRHDRNSLVNDTMESETATTYPDAGEELDYLGR